MSCRWTRISPLSCCGGNGSPTRMPSFGTTFQTRLLGWSCSFLAMSRAVTTMRVRSSRTTFVLPGAVSWDARNAGRLSESGVSRKVWCEMGSSPYSSRAVEGCREVRLDWLAYVPPHLSFLAGSHRSTHGSAAETHAARPNLDHDERVWQRVDGSQARGQRRSR